MATPELKIGVSFPGESIGVALIAYMQSCRETASQENRDKFDALTIQFFQDWQNFWRAAVGK